MMSEEPYSHTIDDIQKKMSGRTVELELNSRIVLQRLCKQCGAQLGAYQVRRVEWEIKDETLYHRLYGEAVCSECITIDKIVLERKY